MSGIDIILDMVIGSEKDESPRQQNPVNSPEKNDLMDIFRMHCTQLESLKLSLRHFSFQKMFRGKFSGFRKRKNNLKINNNPDMDVAAALARMDNVLNFCNNSLKNGWSEYPRQPFPENKVDDNQLVEYGKNSSEEPNNTKETEDKHDLSDIQDKNIHDAKKHGLDLFFTSILNTTAEFNDEEILDLEIQILKIIKNIKGKRELRQHLRRYCSTSLNFKDSSFFTNDFKINLM